MAQQRAITYSNPDEVQNIGGYAFYFLDSTRSFSIQDIIGLDQHFVQSSRSVPNFGNSKDVLWCKFTITNKSEEDLFLEFRRALFDYITLYYPDSSGNYKSIETGSKLPRNTRPINDNYFIFRLPDLKVSQTYYLRFENVGHLTIPLNAGTAKSIFIKHRKEELFYGLCFGLILTLTLYNLLIYFAIRDRTYLYYIGYLLLSLVAYDFSAIGIGGEFIYNDFLSGFNYYFLMDLLVGLTVVANLSFISKFLDLSGKLPVIAKINRWFYVAIVIVAIANLIPKAEIIPFTQLFIITSCLYIFMVIVYALRSKIRRARFLLVGWSVYLLSIIIFEFYVLGIIPYGMLAVHAVLLGLCFEALFFSFALADRIREMRKEKEDAQQNMLDLIKNQNKVLEHEVADRTQEIAAQNEELAAQNEELITLQEQLSIQKVNLEEQNKTLEDAQRIIEDQNEALKRYAGNLEDNIKVKTNDLINSNLELIRQNNQLQQFSFITAHNLRAPVARLLGLIQVLDFTNTEDDKTRVLNGIYKTGQDLDQIIRDLSLILDLRKGSTENFESVSIIQQIDRVKTLLRSEIEKNQTEILVDVLPTECIYGLSAYLDSILYNLISNSIKYRSPDRNPIIQIKAERFNSKVNISFSDNGLGIDLNAHGNKVFGLYKRFHLHTEGKGIGLHLVKTQVEAMGGTITIKSELNLGTSFDIRLPAPLVKS